MFMEDGKIRTNCFRREFFLSFGLETFNRREIPIEAKTEKDIQVPAQLMMKEHKKFDPQSCPLKH